MRVGNLTSYKYRDLHLAAGIMGGKREQFTFFRRTFLIYIYILRGYNEDSNYLVAPV